MSVRRKVELLHLKTQKGERGKYVILKLSCAQWETGLSFTAGGLTDTGKQDMNREPLEGELIAVEYLVEVLQRLKRETLELTDS